MRLTIVLISFLGLSGIYYRRYLEHVKGIHIKEIFRRQVKKLFKVPSKHVIAAKKVAAEQKEEINKKVFKKADLKEKTPGDFEKADTIFNRADYLLSRGEIDEARKLLVQSLSLNVGHEGANHKLGTLYIQDQEFNKAEIIYLQLTQIFPKTPKYFSHLGLIYFNQNQLEKARDAYKKATKLDDSRASRFISLARVYEELDDHVFAVKNFQKARQVDPRNIEGLLAFSEYYIRQGEKKGAEELLDEVLRISPRNEHASKLLKQITTL